MSTTTLLAIVHGIIALALIAATTTLLALHDLSEPTALALYGAALAIVGGTTSTLLALKVPTEPSSSSSSTTTSPPVA